LSAVCQRTDTSADRSATVIDLEKVRVERLAARLVPDLRGAGMSRSPIADIDDVTRWRRAARRAGRLLGWRV
jgi:hypothetical protein